MSRYALTGAGDLVVSRPEGSQEPKLEITCALPIHGGAETESGHVLALTAPSVVAHVDVSSLLSGVVE